MNLEQINIIIWFYAQVKSTFGRRSITAITMRQRPTKVPSEYTLLVAIGNAPNVMATKIVNVPNYQNNHGNQNTLCLVFIRWNVIVIVFLIKIGSIDFILPRLWEERMQFQCSKVVKFLEIVRQVKMSHLDKNTK